MANNLFTTTLIFIVLNIGVTHAQDLYVYHGKTGETTVFDSGFKPVSKISIRKSKGDHFIVKILNPNPLFYKYELKYDEQEDASEDKDVKAALATFASIMGAGNPAAGGGPDPNYTDYIDALKAVQNDILTAKKIIERSDNPEPPEAALKMDRTGGLRLAVEQITYPTNLPFSDYFLSSRLEDELKAKLAAVAAATIDATMREAFGLLNSSLVNQVAAIKTSMLPPAMKTVMTSEFVVTDKVTKVYLVITPVSTSRTNIRETFSETTKLEMATIEPLFERSTLELVPVGAFLFAGDTKEFYMENNVVNQRDATKTVFSPGVVLNINLLRFGDRKEMALGVGPGYKFNDKSTGFESFYFSTLFSYKAFLRIGFGFGFAQFPNGLKDGGQVGAALPANIKDLNDIITYKDVPTGFLTISFTGLTLVK